MVAEGVISGSIAKDVFRLMLEERVEPQEIVTRHGLGQISDEAALRELVAAVVDEHPDEAAQYRAGKEKLLGFFVGQIMKATGGRANPQLVNELLRAALQQ